MPQVIQIDFPEDSGDGVLVHRIRNFGEDLWKEYRDSDDAEVNLDAVDRATTRLEIVIRSPAYKDSALACARKLLRDHNLSEIADLRSTERDEPSKV